MHFLPLQFVQFVDIHTTRYLPFFDWNSSDSVPASTCVFELRGRIKTAKRRKFFLLKIISSVAHNTSALVYTFCAMHCEIMHWATSVQQKHISLCFVFSKFVVNEFVERNMTPHRQIRSALVQWKIFL